MSNSIHKELSKIISPLFLVGGAVRDTVMGVKITDYDFCTPLVPSEVEMILKENNFKTFIIGKRFGTIGTVIHTHNIEITTFRNESYTKGSRKPLVEFGTDLNEDLKRRDFTMNAMALDITDTLIDPFNGQKDIENKIIRCVGDVKERFHEDPLRMLRAVRFSASLGFEVEKKTFDGACQCKEDILNISRERWLQEMDKLIKSKYPEKGLKLLKDTGLLKIMVKASLTENKNFPKKLKIILDKFS